MFQCIPFTGIPFNLQTQTLFILFQTLQNFYPEQKQNTLSSAFLSPILPLLQRKPFLAQSSHTKNCVTYSYSSKTYGSPLNFQGSTASCFCCMHLKAYVQFSDEY